MRALLTTSRRGRQTPGVEVKDHCEHLGCWESNPDALKQQLVLSIIKTPPVLTCIVLSENFIWKLVVLNNIGIKRKMRYIY